MGTDKVTIDLPSYLSIDIDDGLKIEIDTDKYLNSLKTYDIIYHLEGRHDYDIDCEYFNRGLEDNASVVDCLIQAAKTLAPRRILDKATIKEIINDFIDSSLDNRCYK